MTPPRSAKIPMDEEEESEWEYEYHETETEVGFFHPPPSTLNLLSIPATKILQNFYITLDLSSHSRKFAQGVKQPPSVSTSNDPPIPAPAFPPLNLPPEGQDPRADEVSRTAQGSEAPATALDPLLNTEAQKQKRIQIADLHTLNPLISYNSQLYSCEWTTTLGTDMLFAAAEPQSDPDPDLEPETSSQPARSTSLISATRIKLSARPIQVIPRPENVSLATSKGADNFTATATPTRGTPLIPLAPTAKPNRQNQAAFLTDLINIKRAKGETDEVNVHAGTRGPYGGGAAGGLIGNGEECEGDEDGESLWKPGASPTKVGRGSSRARSRGRGRGRTGRKRKMSSGVGLFRDYQPDGLDGEMATAQRTPERWEDLSRPVDFVERNMAGAEGQDMEEAAGGAAVDWRQRLSKHLYAGRPPVVAPGGGNNHGPRNSRGAADRRKDEGEDVEMDDV